MRSRHVDSVGCIFIGEGGGLALSKYLGAQSMGIVIWRSAPFMLLLGPAIALAPVAWPARCRLPGVFLLLSALNLAPVVWFLSFLCCLLTVDHPVSGFLSLEVPMASAWVSHSCSVSSSHEEGSVEMGKKQ